MAEFMAHQIPAVVLAAPTWEVAAKAIARAVKVPESQVIALPLGDFFADSADAAERMRETAHEVMPLVANALRKAYAIPAA